MEVPAGWVRCLDADSGAFYLSNEATGESKWEEDDTLGDEKTEDALSDGGGDGAGLPHTSHALEAAGQLGSTASDVVVTAHKVRTFTFQGSDDDDEDSGAGGTESGTKEIAQSSGAAGSTSVVVRPIGGSKARRQSVPPIAPPPREARRASIVGARATVLGGEKTGIAELAGSGTGSDAQVGADEATTAGGEAPGGGSAPHSAWFFDLSAGEAQPTIMDVGPVSTEMRAAWLTHTALRGVPFLSTCTVEDSSAISRLFRCKSAEAGAVVQTEGNPCLELCFLASGTMKMSSRATGASERTVGAGGFIGAEALLKRGARAIASATCTEQCELLTVTHDALVDGMGPSFTLRMLSSYIQSEALALSVFLADVPFFSELDDRAMRLLTDRCKALTLPTGSVVVKEGTHGDAFYLLLQGKLRVSARGRRLCDLSSGSYVGEISLLRGVTTTATVKTVEDSLLLVLHKDAFTALMEDVPELRGQMDAHVRERTAMRLASLQASLFDGVDEPVLRALGRVVHHRRFEAGHQIFGKGESTGQTCFVVTQGIVSISGTASSGAEQLGTGAYFGEEALVSQGPRPYTAVAATPLSCLEFSCADVHAAFDKNIAALARFELRILQDKASLTHVLRHPDGMEAFKQFVDGVTDDSILNFVLEADNFARSAMYGGQDAQDLAATAGHIVERYFGGTSAVARRLSRTTKAQIASAVNKAVDGVSLPGPSLFAKAVGEAKGPHLDQQFANFQLERQFASLLRRVGQPSKDGMGAKKHSKLYGDFRASKLNRYGQWQARIFRFDVNLGELVVEDTKGNNVHQFKLLGVHKVERSNRVATDLRLVFHSGVRDYNLRFHRKSARESFCVLLRILEPDLLFTDDCESVESSHCVSYDVVCALRGVRKRRILVIDSDLGVLRRINPRRDTFKDTRLSPTFQMTESITDPCRLQYTAEEGEVWDVIFPAASVRTRFAGRVRAVTHKIDISKARVLGLRAAGYTGPSLRVFCGTWNAGESKVNLSSVAKWLPNDGTFDMFAVGLQECDDRDKWIAAIVSHLCGTDDPSLPKKSTGTLSRLRGMSRAMRSSSVTGASAAASPSDAGFEERRPGWPSVPPAHPAFPPEVVAAAADLTDLEFNVAIFHPIARESLRLWAAADDDETVDMLDAIAEYHGACDAAGGKPDKRAVELARNIATRFLRPGTDSPVKLPEGIRSGAERAALRGAVARDTFDMVRAAGAFQLERGAFPAWQRALKQEAQLHSVRNRLPAVKKYVKLTSVSLWGIHLLIIVAADLAPQISHVQTHTEATGIAGVMGNKGGAAASFVFQNSTSFGFVSSHLAAQHGKVRQRGENYEEICRNLVMAGVHPKHQFLHQFDHVFWVGDLNYRIDLGRGEANTAAEFKAVQQLISENKLWRLREADQLLVERRSRDRVFCGFREGLLCFAPTYRMDKKSAAYNNKKNQNASWCDRVLLRSRPGLQPRVRQLFYHGHADILGSDHRPVSAAFQLELPLPYINVGHLDGASGPQVHLSLSYLEAQLSQGALDSNDAVVSGGAGSGAGIRSPHKLTDPGARYSGADGIGVDTSTTGSTADELVVTISAPFLAEGMVSTRARPCAEDATYRWADEDIPVVVPFVADMSWLRDQHVLLAVRHKSGAVVAQAELWLKTAAGSGRIPSDELTLDHVLADPDLMQAFEDTIIREYAAENLEFYRAVERFRSIALGEDWSRDGFAARVGVFASTAARPPPSREGSQETRSPPEQDALRREARALFDLWVDSRSPSMVDLPSAVLDRLRAALEGGPAISPYVFDEAQSMAYKTMATDTFMRFRKAYRAESELIRKRGGGNIFTLDLVKDGSKAGEIRGQASLQLLETVATGEERLEALERIMRQLRAGPDSEGAGGEGESATGADEDKSVASSDSGIDSAEEEDLMVALLSSRKTNTAAVEAGSSSHPGSEDAEEPDGADDLTRAVKQELAKVTDCEECSRLRVLLKLTFDRMRQAERQLEFVPGDEEHLV